MEMIVYFIATGIISGFLIHLFFYWVYRSTDVPGAATEQRLNYYLPEYDIWERHKIIIYSSPEKVFETIHTFDMRKSKVINILFALRGIFLLFKTNKKPGYEIPMSIDQLTQKDALMFLLEKVKNKEVVIGAAGKFWRLQPAIVSLSNAEDFISFNIPGYCKTAWNLHIKRNADGIVTLSTETRVICYGVTAKTLFRLYWAIIRPYSGWIRLEILKIIKEQAESR